MNEEHYIVWLTGRTDEELRTEIDYFESSIQILVNSRLFNHVVESNKVFAGLVRFELKRRNIY